LKKLIIAAALLMIGCAKEEVKKEPLKSCGCDRIVSAPRHTILIPVEGSTQAKEIYFASIITVNDCSNWQKNWSYRSEYNRFSQKIGECYNQ
jgi:hypothetical protein